jgi:hypothetical protein
VENDKVKLDCSNIGFNGNPIDTLTREELLEAFLELAQKVHDCAVKEGTCKDVFTVSE